MSSEGNTSFNKEVWVGQKGNSCAIKCSQFLYNTLVIFSMFISPALFAANSDVYLDVGSTVVKGASYNCVLNNGQQVPDTITIWYTISSNNSGVTITASPSVLSSGSSGYAPFMQNFAAGVGATPGVYTLSRYAQGVKCSGVARRDFQLVVMPVLAPSTSGNAVESQNFEVLKSVTASGHGVTPINTVDSKPSEIYGLLPQLIASPSAFEECQKPLKKAQEKISKSNSEERISANCEPEWPPLQNAPSTTSDTLISDNSKPQKPEQFWWFNGQTPANYQTQYTLTALPNKPGLSYQWKVLSGGDIVRFPNGSTTHTTYSNSTSLSAIRGSVQPNDVVVIVSVNEVESRSRRLTVLKPYKLLFQGFEDTLYAPSPFIWKTMISYQIVDQLGNVLPHNLPVNEKFTSGRLADYPSTNWQMPAANGNGSGPNTSPFNMTDIIGRLVSNDPTPLIPTPLVVINQAELNMEKVMHFTGEFYVGGSYAGTGCRVQTLTWQLYRDHGRHVSVLSPAP